MKRTTTRRSYTRKGKKKEKVKNLTPAEEELMLLDPLEFVIAKKPLCFGNASYIELRGPVAACCRLFKLTDRDLRKFRKCFFEIDNDQSGNISQVNSLPG